MKVGLYYDGKGGSDAARAAKRLAHELRLEKFQVRVRDSGAFTPADVEEFDLVIVPADAGMLREAYSGTRIVVATDLAGFKAALNPEPETPAPAISRRKSTR